MQGAIISGVTPDQLALDCVVLENYKGGKALLLLNDKIVYHNARGIIAAVALDHIALDIVVWRTRKAASSPPSFERQNRTSEYDSMNVVFFP
jgi:hypothetical protein